MNVADKLKLIGTNLFHILLVVPLLLYIGIQGARGKPVPVGWYYVLIAAAAVALAVHLMLMITKLKKAA